MLGVDVITVYRWETARRFPRGRNLVTYACFLERLGADLREAAEQCGSAHGADCGTA